MGWGHECCPDVEAAVERDGKTKICDSILHMLPGLAAMEPEGQGMADQLQVCSTEGEGH